MPRTDEMIRAITSVVHGREAVRMQRDLVRRIYAADGDAAEAEALLEELLRSQDAFERDLAELERRNVVR